MNEKQDENTSAGQTINYLLIMEEATLCWLGERRWSGILSHPDNLRKIREDINSLTFFTVHFNIIAQAKYNVYSMSEKFIKVTVCIRGLILPHS
jgi:hypothetical protein